ncbi:MAG: hypothetical protein H7Y60_04435 [Rhodospirillaceae bacterium]|nr:hypothetical protein [Rhodospirillales bacterium]
MSSATMVGRLAGSMALAAMLAACQTAREQEVQVKPELAHAYLADKPTALQKHFMATLNQGKRNQVLNHMRLGLAALEMGDNALAESLLDDALLSIESIYVNNAEAEKARGLFTKEMVKDFKGEPYERAMAYYYRGLLYMRAGDYDNARASFKGGFIQDSFADEDQNRADFGLLQYLQGWASRCRGNGVTAEEDFKEFSGINDKFPLPATADNTLVLVESGSAPIKFSEGDANSSKPKYLKYRRASASETARISFTDTVPPPAPKKGEKPKPAQEVSRSVALTQLEDIYFQASTRGGREFDSVLAGKAQFQSTTNTVGNVALAGAVIAASYANNANTYQQQRDGAAAAGALLLIGLLAKAAAEATEADADTRYWDNLPDRIHAVSLTLPPMVTSLSVDFLASDGTLVRTREAKVTHAGACGLGWVRGESAMPANPRAPNSAPAETMYSPVVIPPRPSFDAKSLPGDKPAEYTPKPDSDSKS